MVVRAYSSIWEDENAHMCALQGLSWHSSAGWAHRFTRPVWPCVWFSLHVLCGYQNGMCACTKTRTHQNVSVSLCSNKKFANEIPHLVTVPWKNQHVSLQQNQSSISIRIITASCWSVQPFLMLQMLSYLMEWPIFVGTFGCCFSWYNSCIWGWVDVPQPTEGWVRLNFFQDAVAWESSKRCKSHAATTQAGYRSL